MITRNPMTSLERRATASLATLYSFRMLGLFMVLPLLALYATDMPGASPALIGLALGIYGLTQALMQVPLGMLSDRIGRKPVIVGGLLLFAAGSVLAAMADSVTGIVIGRALQGAGAIAGSLMALVADLTRDEQRTKAMALVGASIGMSFAVSLVLGPAVAAQGGLASVFGLTAVLALGGIAIVSLVVPTPPAPQVEYGDAGTRGRLLLRSLNHSGLRRLNAGVFVLHFVLMASFLLIPELLEGGLGIDRSRHWQVYLPVVLLSLLGMVPLMRQAERYGRIRQMFATGIAALVVALAMIGFAQGTLWWYLALWLFFVGFNYLEATLPSLVSRTVFPGGRGTALGVYSTCQFMGAFAGGALGGWVLQVFGPASLAGLCLALLVVWLAFALPVPQVAPPPENSPV